jgi:hypothetical protein
MFLSPECVLKHSKTLISSHCQPATSYIVLVVHLISNRRVVSALILLCETAGNLENGVERNLKWFPGIFTAGGYASLQWVQ